MDGVVKLKQIEGDSLSGKIKDTQSTSASTPISTSKRNGTSVQLHVLDTSTISNISCSEKNGTSDADATVTNVTVIEVCSDVSDTPRASKLDVDDKVGKENVKPRGSKDVASAKCKDKKREVAKKRKRVPRVVHYSDSDDSEEDTIVFMENPKKDIQMNQSTTEEFLRLGSSEQEVAVGIFWDIENVRMPKGLNPAILISKLREKFVDESSKFCEKHFYVVCDAREESYLIMKQLFEFHVRIIHVPRLKANSSDNVIRDLMHEFVGYNKYCRVILISGDCDFSHDIHNFRRNKKCDCILIHNKNAKKSLIQSATSAYLYTDLMEKEIIEHQAQQAQQAQGDKKEQLFGKCTYGTQKPFKNQQLTKQIPNQQHVNWRSQPRASHQTTASQILYTPRVAHRNPFAQYPNNQAQYTNQAAGQYNPFSQYLNQFNNANYQFRW